MVEDLNDDEVMELCFLSNGLNACETTVTVNPSKVASCATQWISQLQEPTEQCGTSVLKMTEQNSDDCRIENSLNFLWVVFRQMTSLWSKHAEPRDYFFWRTFIENYPQHVKSKLRPT